MLRPDEQLILGHAGLSPQARATLQDTLANRAVILTQTPGDGSTGAGSVTGGSSTTDGIVYANTTIPAGNTIANTVAATSFTSQYQFLANDFSKGRVIVVKAWGVYGTNIVAPNITGTLLLNATTILTTGAATAIAGVTNGGWWTEAQLHVTSAGGFGTVEAQGYAEFSTAATTGLSVNMANTAPKLVNTTIPQTLAIQITWSAANAANTITLRNISIRLDQAQNYS